MIAAATCYCKFACLLKNILLLLSVASKKYCLVLSQLGEIVRDKQKAQGGTLCCSIGGCKSDIFGSKSFIIFNIFEL